MGLFVFHLCGYAGEKRALIVAISKYPDHTGWRQINADNDVKILRNTLLMKGFSENNIIVLLDSMAKKKQVVAAFQSLQKVANTGDFIFIHFSTHGQQMEDDDGDEPDGLDEAIVCYDAQMYYSESYKGENHLRDDEINTLLLPIRKKLGETGNVIVSLDACHSQSTTRAEDDDEDVFRGTSIVFSEKPGFKGYKTDIPKPDLFQEKGLAPITELAACKSNEVNYEYQKHGFLTYALCTVWDKYPTLPAYHLWSEETAKLMKEKRPYQTPVFRTTLK